MIKNSIYLGTEVCIHGIKRLASKVHKPHGPMLQEPFSLLLFCKPKTATIKWGWCHITIQAPAGQGQYVQQAGLRCKGITSLMTPASCKSFTSDPEALPVPVTALMMVIRHWYRSVQLNRASPNGCRQKKSRRSQSNTTSSPAIHPPSHEHNLVKILIW